MSSKGVLNKLYTGGGGLDFVGRRRTWYWTTAAILLVCLVSIALRGFSLGIDFVGGTKINMPAGNLETASVSKTFEDATGVEPKLVQIVGAGDTRILEINSKRLSEEQIGSARQALLRLISLPTPPGNKLQMLLVIPRSQNRGVLRSLSGC